MAKPKPVQKPLPSGLVLQPWVMRLVEAAKVRRLALNSGAFTTKESA